MAKRSMCECAHVEVAGVGEARAKLADDDGEGLAHARGGAEACLHQKQPEINQLKYRQAAFLLC